MKKLILILISLMFLGCDYEGLSKDVKLNSRQMNKILMNFYDLQKDVSDLKNELDKNNETGISDNKHMFTGTFQVPPKINVQPEIVNYNTSLFIANGLYSKTELIEYVTEQIEFFLNSSKHPLVKRIIIEKDDAGIYIREER